MIRIYYRKSRKTSYNNASKKIHEHGEVYSVLVVGGKGRVGGEGLLGGQVRG